MDPETLAVVYPEPAPGTTPGCYGPPIDECPEPYATSERYFGFGPGAEDWAETFASFVYRDYWRSRIQPKTGLVSCLVNTLTKLLALCVMGSSVPTEETHDYWSAETAHCA